MPPKKMATTRPCETCSGVVPPYYATHGYRRCSACRKQAPGVQRVKSETRCATCPGFLSATEAREHYRRCYRCRVNGTPLPNPKRPVRVKRKHGPRLQIISKPKAEKPRRRSEAALSWWTVPMSRADFMQRAEALHAP